MKLNLCCGPNLFYRPGWVNLDRVDQTEYLRILREDVSAEMAATWPDDQRRLSDHLRNGGKVDFRQHDARRPLAMFEDGSVDAIYLGQCVEHFNRQHGIINLLAECHTLLRKGGILRITTPDLDKLLDAYRLGRMHQFCDEQPAYYAKAAPADQLAYILYGATGADCQIENYEGHFHCFTRGTLATALTEAGFSGPYRFFDEPGQGELAGEVVDKGLSHSLCVEAVK
jgi:SAM-dependent methyltransferase